MDRLIRAGLFIRTKQDRREQDRTEQDKRGQNRTEQKLGILDFKDSIYNRTEQDRNWEF